MKKYFFWIFIPLIILIGIGTYFLAETAIIYMLIAPFFFLGLYDILQRKHTILRNFPVIGHFRFMLEAIRPEIHQYFIESDLEGRPINRERRSIIYQRAKATLDTLPYGTRWDLYQVGYEWINHSLKAKRPITDDPRVEIGSDQCSQPYSASILNISAMSFGALSARAVEALNLGAKLGNFSHNTGEGGLSPYHLKQGGDIVWQLGTACFGARTPDGEFCPQLFKERARLPQVKMIEIKLSQGAKPGHGGILPAVKLTKEIAEIRGVHMGKDVLSPPTHDSFSNPIEMMQWIAELRELSGGKPIGFKLCVGSRREFMAICKGMLETKIVPDFITVDGGEGGTGAAPLEFSNGVGSPLNEGLVFVHNCIVGIGLRDQIKIISSGKLMTGLQIVTKLAMAADCCNSARAMMLAVGCIQSLKCNTNRCPTGVTTQDPALQYGLVVKDKSVRVTQYHRETVKAVMEMVGAAGLDHPSDLKPSHIYRRIDNTHVKYLPDVYHYLEPGALLGDPEKLPPAYARIWAKAKADSF